MMQLNKERKLIWLHGEKLLQVRRQARTIERVAAIYYCHCVQLHLSDREWKEITIIVAFTEQIARKQNFEKTNYNVAVVILQKEANIVLWVLVFVKPSWKHVVWKVAKFLLLVVVPAALHYLNCCHSVSVSAYDRCVGPSDYFMFLKIA